VEKNLLLVTHRIYPNNAIVIYSKREEGKAFVHANCMNKNKSYFWTDLLL
jgi:hypothetical protein